MSYKDIVHKNTGKLDERKRKEEQEKEEKIKFFVALDTALRKYVQDEDLMDFIKKSNKDRIRLYDEPSCTGHGNKIFLTEDGKIVFVDPSNNPAASDTRLTFLLKKLGGKVEGDLSAFVQEGQAFLCIDVIGTVHCEMDDMMAKYYNFHFDGATPEKIEENVKEAVTELSK